MKKSLLTLLSAIVAGIPSIAANITGSTWEKVSAAGDFDPSARYIMVSGTAICSYTTNAATSSYLKPCSGTVSVVNNEISSIPEDAAIFTVKALATAGTYAVMISDYQGTLKGYFNSTAAKSMQLKSAEADATPATLNIPTSGTAMSTFKFKSGTTDVGSVYYNSSAPRFLNYTSPQTAVFLYKEKGEISSCAAPQFGDIANGSEVSAGTVITVTCATAGSTVYIKCGDETIEGEAGTAKAEFAVPESAIGTSVSLTAYATVTVNETLLTSENTEISFNVVKAPSVIRETLTYESFSSSPESSYKNLTYTSPETGIMYYGKLSLGGSTSPRLQFTNSTSGTSAYSGLLIYDNPKGYTLKSIEFERNVTNSNERTMLVYGKNSPYVPSDPANPGTVLNALYSSEDAIRGESLGSVIIPATTAPPVSLTINKPQLYVGMISKTNALYLNSITFVWEIPEGGPEPVVPGQVVSEPAAEDEEIIVEIGETVTFTSEKAAGLMIEIDEGEPFEAKNPYEYTVTKDVVLTITPFDSKKTQYDDKSLMVMITAIEPLEYDETSVTFDFTTNQYGHEVQSGNSQTYDPSSVFTEEPVSLKTTEKTRFWETSGKPVELRVTKSESVTKYGFNLEADGLKITGIEMTAGAKGGTDKWTFNPASSEITEGSACVWEGKETHVEVRNTTADTNSLQKLTVHYMAVAQPTKPIVRTEGNTLILMSERGHLHVLVEEFDSEGNEVLEFETKPSKSVPLDDYTWENRVAGEKEEYSVSAPLTEGNTLRVRSKSVINGLHSPEAYRVMDTNGNVYTGVEAVIADPGKSRWFNLQGQPVENPAEGIYIRVCGSKAEKVIL